jgi:hypothetical protein
MMPSAAEDVNSIGLLKKVKIDKGRSVGPTYPLIAQKIL